MSLPKLKSVTRTQGNNKALKDGLVRPRTFEFDWLEVNPLIDAFRRMVRGLEFDITEMAFTTYVCARSYGKPFTALPIFIVRAFHHGAILVNTRSGITSPKDLEGMRVGVNRGYTVTTGLWARSILQHQYGVDLKSITWVLSGDEHVEEYRAPANVVPIEKGRKMGEMLASGELVAAIGVDIDHPDVKPLIPNAKEAGFAALRDTGHYPINHAIAVRDELLDQHPGLAEDIFEAFVESKKLYLADGPVEETHRRVQEITGKDPLPYGIEPNRPVLEQLIASALEQGIITTPVTPEDLFPRSTHALVG
jgi:4,5-dihydroxyphthalate decarboxylase